MAEQEAGSAIGRVYYHRPSWTIPGPFYNGHSPSVALRALWEGGKPIRNHAQTGDCWVFLHHGNQLKLPLPPIPADAVTGEMMSLATFSAATLPH